MDINQLQSGRTFEVKKAGMTAPEKDPMKMTLQELNAYQQANQNPQAAVNKIRSDFEDYAADNGKVDILIEGENGVAHISGTRISIAELSQQGEAAAEYAMQLRDHDENKDGFIEEHELITDGGERAGEAAMTVGAYALGGFSVGSIAGATGGTFVVPGLGTFVGWLAIGGLGAAAGAIAGVIDEGISTAMWAYGDNHYNSPDHIR